MSVFPEQDMQQELLRLRRNRERAEADTRRLDWLEKHPGSVRFDLEGGRPCWVTYEDDASVCRHDSLRNAINYAIDSAISAQSEKTK